MNDFFKRVDKLYSQGVTKIHTFNEIAEQTGYSPATISNMYYKYKANNTPKIKVYVNHRLLGKYTLKGDKVTIKL
jgi:DNA-binding Lrp family transcriptional regulator